MQMFSCATRYEQGFTALVFSFHLSGGTQRCSVIEVQKLWRVCISPRRYIDSLRSGCVFSVS